MRSRRSSVSATSLRPDSSVSPSRTTPWVGRSSPAAQCRNVLLPDPDGPMTAVKLPRANEMLTSSSAVTAPPPDPYTLDTEASSTAGLVVVTGSGIFVPNTPAPSSTVDGFNARDGGVRARSCWVPGSR